MALKSTGGKGAKRTTAPGAARRLAEKSKAKRTSAHQASAPDLAGKATLEQGSGSAVDRLAEVGVQAVENAIAGAPLNAREEGPLGITLCMCGAGLPPPVWREGETWAVVRCPRCGAETAIRARVPRTLRLLVEPDARPLSYSKEPKTRQVRVPGWAVVEAESIAAAHAFSLQAVLSASVWFLATTLGADPAHLHPSAGAVYRALRDGRKTLSSKRR